MVQEYVTRYYLPCSTRFNTLCSGDFAGAKDLAAWRQKLMTGWKDVSVEELTSRENLEMPVGQEVEVIAKVTLGTLSPEDVIVEAYYGRLDHQGDFVGRETLPLDIMNSTGAIHTFRGHIPCRETGRFGFTVRVMPSHKRLENRFVMGLVSWA
jgi:starch phosphorylase